MSDNVREAMAAEEWWRTHREGGGTDDDLVRFVQGWVARSALATPSDELAVKLKAALASLVDSLRRNAPPALAIAILAAARELPTNLAAPTSDMSNVAGGSVSPDAGRLIGTLLDAWEGIPNDERPPKLERPFRDIYKAIDDGMLYAAPSKCPACGGDGRVLGDYAESLVSCQHCKPVTPADDEVEQAAQVLIDAIDFNSPISGIWRIKSEVEALRRRLDAKRLKKSGDDRA